MTEKEKSIYFKESMKRKTVKQKEMEADTIRLQKLKNQFKRDLR